MTDIGKEINSQAYLALNALQEYNEAKRSNQLFPDLTADVHLLISYKRSPLTIVGARRKFIHLPYPDRNPSNTSICLILPDFDLSKKAANDPDVDRQAREWAEQLRERHNLRAGIDYAKIFTMKQLEREYSQVPDRTKLANAYDLFMVDRMLMRKVLYFMGRHFKRSTKMPLPINAHRNFISALQKATSITQLMLEPMKDSVAIRIGNLNQPVSHLQSNLVPVLDAFLQSCPGGPINIRSAYLKSMGTSLPVFVDFGSANDVQLECPKRHEYPEHVDECTTLPEGLAVRVRADGKVTTVDTKTGQEVLYPTEQDEWEKTDDLKPLSKEQIAQIVQKTAQKKQQKMKKNRKRAECGGTKKEEEVGGNVESEEEGVKKKKNEAKEEEKMMKKVRPVKRKRKSEQQEGEEEEGKEMERPNKLELMVKKKKKAK